MLHQAITRTVTRGPLGEQVPGNLSQGDARRDWAQLLVGLVGSPIFTNTNSRYDRDKLDELRN